MKCGSCQKTLPIGTELQPKGVTVGFRTSKGVDITIYFCSVQCCWWGGQKYARSTNPGAPTNKRTFRQLYPGAIV
jgi:hypothetical protein